MTDAPKYIRRMRHWKQRWKPNAQFIWARAIFYGGERAVPGEPVPQDLLDKPNKLRRFWESKAIALAEFEAPDVTTGVVDHPIDAPEGVSVNQLAGDTYVVKAGEDETVVEGRESLDQLLEELRLD